MRARRAPSENACVLSGASTSDSSIVRAVFVWSMITNVSPLDTDATRPDSVSAAGAPAQTMSVNAIPQTVCCVIIVLLTVSVSIGERQL